MADVTHLQFFINHVERPNITWNQDGPEEVLGGQGRCTFEAQDQTNSWEPQDHWDVKVVIRASGWVLFHGQIEHRSIKLQTGHPWRTWKLDCADYNIEFGRRLVGALDGKTWIDPMGFGFFVNIDPFAETLRTDKLTVQNWLDHYIRIDGTTAIETTSFVNEYLADFLPITPERDTLQGSLEKLAALVVDNLQFWLDPDDKFHWVVIPPWQDLIQDAVAASLDASSQQMGLLFPEGDVELPFAPTDITDTTGMGVGLDGLSIDYDGSAMPEQIYVNGSTGYVYNSPPLTGTENKTVVTSPTAGTPGTYQLTIQSTTKIWHTDSTGYVSTSYDSASPGGPYAVKWVSVPWNEARNKGGNYWKFTSGPYAGKLADDHTNSLSGYGSILVEKVTTGAPGTPLVGIGGSGFVNEALQDATKRQAYLDAAVSDSKSARDSFGGQALYRGQFATLRGSVVIRGVDGWRVGQLVKIVDARLPSELNGRWFVIQRVKVNPLPETGILEYTLDWGDGPKSRYSAEQRGGGDVNWPPPAIQIDVSVQDLSPGPNSTQIITGQLVDKSGKPWALKGKTVDWSFECYDRLGVLQTGQGSITPTVSITDAGGRARTKLTTGSGTNLVYFVFADVKAV